MWTPRPPDAWEDAACLIDSGDADLVYAGYVHVWLGVDPAVFAAGSREARAVQVAVARQADKRAAEMSRLEEVT